MTDRVSSAGDKRRQLLIPALVFFLLTLGCSAADLLQRDVATPTPAPTRILAPTFTPTPEGVGIVVVVTPPVGGTPGVIVIPPNANPSDYIPIPTDTPAPPTPETGQQPESPLDVPFIPPLAEPTAIPTNTATPLPTNTPTNTPTVTPTATATPFIVVENGLISLRTGPGLDYPLVAQLGPDIPVAVIGRNPQGDWFQICCVSGESVWVSANSVEIFNEVSEVALIVPDEAPTATPTGTPTETPTVTPTPTSTRYPFERAIGPQFFPTNNEFLTIWVKLFIKPDPNAEEDPAAGYYLKVLFEGFDRPGTNDRRPSRDQFEFSAPLGAGNRVEYNLKYEYRPPDPKADDPNATTSRLELIGNGEWTVFVVDGAGRQLSDEVSFTTTPSNPNREIYIGWIRIR